jgi:hypothetical protein
VRFPEQRTAVVCLCNLSTANPSDLTRRVADIYLADKLGPAPAAPTDDRPTVAVGADELKGYEGLYWQTGTDNYRRFAAKNGALESVYGQSGVALKSVGGGVFAGRTTDFKIEVGADGRRRLTETVRGGTAKPIAFEGVEPFAPTPAQAAEYKGCTTARRSSRRTESTPLRARSCSAT